jgi:hypothetical protein
MIQTHSGENTFEAVVEDLLSNQEYYSIGKTFDQIVDEVLKG